MHESVYKEFHVSTNVELTKKTHVNFYSTSETAIPNIST